MALNHIDASSFYETNLNIGISVLFICKFPRNKGLAQNVGLFHLEIGLA